jgi:TFIIS helical bundle-like domain
MLLLLLLVLLIVDYCVLTLLLGGYDLLLHLLSNISALPVNKNAVKDSGMGKVIGSIDKHPMCASGPNAPAIKSRVEVIKDSWNKSVKARKAHMEAQPVPKRQLEGVTPMSPTTAKRVKTADDEANAARGVSFSSLIKKVSGAGNGASVPPVPKSPVKSQEVSTGSTSANSSTATGQGDDKGKAAHAHQCLNHTCLGNIGTNDITVPHLAISDLFLSSLLLPAAQKKAFRKVKWADHFGGYLEASGLDESSEVVPGESHADNNVSWTDRKKRDRLREKELLASAK